MASVKREDIVRIRGTAEKHISSSRGRIEAMTHSTDHSIQILSTDLAESNTLTSRSYKRRRKGSVFEQAVI
jgi:Tol biopolymer transport system component